MAVSPRIKRQPIPVPFLTFLQTNSMLHTQAYETFSFRETRTLEIVMELCTGMFWNEVYSRIKIT